MPTTTPDVNPDRQITLSQSEHRQIRDLLIVTDDEVAEQGLRDQLRGMIDDHVRRERAFLHPLTAELSELGNLPGGDPFAIELLAAAAEGADRTRLARALEDHVTVQEHLVFPML